ncbi:aminodeoxychorismate lyase [Corynebacterium wankanglinii]|uniref:Aminodeoxychorismate lyase n=1 Tax=Corynebacterium wankanglinii TaxID=2735136 RepID=A0A838CLV8_9CORY|nr:aminodeoxychorismate lyase [Corynebacterium wankanglinii]MBA1835559.1 aminodeoxychorismate lyase [Corynebacterium wankanglinii]
MVFSQLPPAPVIYLVEPFGGSVRRQNPNMPHVFWDDAAVTRGDGVFESILVRGGTPVNLDKHLDRFARSAKLLGLPDPGREHWTRATEEAVADYCRERGDDNAEGKCTWTLTRGRETTGVPTAWLTVRALPEDVLRQRERGVSVATTARGFSIDNDVPWMREGAKTLNYALTMAALRWAGEQGADDVIFVDPETDRVLEGATSSVLVVKKGGRLRTPAPGAGVMAGTTQAAIFEHADSLGWKCKAKDIYLSELFKAESVWLVSSTRIAARVKRLDGTKLPAPDNAPEIRQLIEGALA